MRIAIDAHAEPVQAAAMYDSNLLELPSDEAHIWFASLEAREPGCLPRADYCALMDADERQRYARIGPAAAREEFLLTRALCRTVLSRYAGVEPASWRFVSNAFGRPRIASPAGYDWLRYNLSNAHGLVVCGVVRDIDIGIDAEAVCESADIDEISRMHFASAEVRALNALPRAARARRFYELWTLKESYLKARGTGLTVSLDCCTFDLDHAGPIRVECAPALSEVAEAWQFEQVHIDERHVVAAAFRGGVGRRLRLRRFAIQT
jgi:4'-phosphopantetheinyl transferase